MSSSSDFFQRHLNKSRFFLFHTSHIEIFDLRPTATFYSLSLVEGYLKPILVISHTNLIQVQTLSHRRIVVHSNPFSAVAHPKFKLFVFFYCIAELAIKPCRSSRSKLRGEFGIPKHLQNRKQKHDKATNTPNPKHNTKQKGHGKCLEGETRGEKRVKRPKRPNALICRTPGGSIRYPLSCSLGMTLISHSIVSIPASPSRFDI